MKKYFAMIAAVALAVGVAAGASAKEANAYVPEVKSGAPLLHELAVPSSPAAAPIVKIGVPSIDVQAAKSRLEAGDTFGALLALLSGLGGLAFGMTTLSVDRGRSYELGDYNEIPAVASDIIYEGAAVGDNGTNAGRPLVAGDRFVGFAETRVDNSTGAAGATNVRVRARGRVQLPISSFDVADVGKAVFASDDDTFTLTQSTNSHIGKAVRFVATGSAIVEFDPHNPPPGLLSEMTDNSGGTANDTLATIPSTYVQAAVNNAIATLASKVNSIIRQMKG